MPLKVAPDPNNPGSWIWVDAATGQPASQPSGPGTPYVAQSDPQPSATNVNIDPNAGARPAPASTTTPNTAGAAGATAAGGANPRQVSLPAGTSPVAEQMLRDVNAQVEQAHTDVAAQSKNIQDLQAKLNAAQSGPNADPTVAGQLTQQINGAYSALSAAETKLASASKNQSDAAQKVLDSVQLTPEQADYYRAQAANANANAAKADADTRVLLDGADTQKAATAAQAGLASANALLANTNAQIAQAKSQPEIDQINAQADAYRAQADQTRQLLPGLLQKQQADISQTDAQTRLTDANSDQVRAQTGQIQANTDLLSTQSRLLVPAQAQQAAGAGAEAQAQAQIGIPAAAQSAQAQAALAASTAGKNLLGPIYGLEDQVRAIQAVKAIQQQIFGPGGSGDRNDANDLLNQYISATIAGTTPYAANVAAANAGLTAFGTQASMYNAAQQALASRANALAGLGGNVLSTLGQMNANAPKGSTAMAGAFQNVIDYLANKTAAQQQAGVPGGMPQQPTPPALPPLLQRLAGQAPTGGTGGSSTLQPGPGGPAGAVPMPNRTPGAPGLSGAVPMPYTGNQPPPLVPMSAPQPQTSAPVTINIGGGQNPSPGPAQQFPQSTLQNQQMPAALQQYAPPTTDFVHQLWSNELQSGAVQSPYNQGPGPGTPAAGSLYY